MSNDKALTSLAADVGEIRDRLTGAEDRLDHQSRVLEQLVRGQGELLASLQQLQVATTSLASSVGLAMSELATARSLERRIERLEAAVFPPKH